MRDGDSLTDYDYKILTDNSNTFIENLLIACGIKDWKFPARAVGAKNKKGVHPQFGADPFPFEILPADPKFKPGDDFGDEPFGQPRPSTTVIEILKIGF